VKKSGENDNAASDRLNSTNYGAHNREGGNGAPKVTSSTLKGLSIIQLNVYSLPAGPSYAQQRSQSSGNWELLCEGEEERIY